MSGFLDAMTARVLLTNNKLMPQNEFEVFDLVVAANFQQYPANFWLQSKKNDKLIATHSRDSLNTGSYSFNKEEIFKVIP